MRVTTNNTNRARPPVKRFSTWNSVLLLLVIVSSVVYALLNLYGKDPSRVMSSRKGDIATSTDMQRRMLDVLDTHQLPVKSHETSNGRWVIRFSDV